MEWFLLVPAAALNYIDSLPQAVHLGMDGMLQSSVGFHVPLPFVLNNLLANPVAGKWRRAVVELALIRPAGLLAGGHQRGGSTPT